MNKVDEYFLKKSQDLYYIEIKSQDKAYEDMGLTGIYIPIMKEDMLKGLRDEEFNEEFEISYFVKGMLMNIAIDPDFIHIDQYKKALKNILGQPAKYAYQKGLEAFEEDPQEAILYFRASYILDPKPYACYNYAAMLWKLDVSEEDRSAFIEKSIEILESIISEDQGLYQPYFELGNIFAATGNYIKARNYYQNALTRADENEEIIRQRLLAIEDDADVMDAIYYINKMDYQKAIEKLNFVNKNSTRIDVPFYLGECFLQSGNPSLAKDHFQEALKRGADFANLYIDYTYTLYVLDQKVDALHIASMGLEKHPADLKLRYNRALIYVDLGELAKANQDLDFILEYQDLSDEFFDMVMKVKQAIS